MPGVVWFAVSSRRRGRNSRQMSCAFRYVRRNDAGASDWACSRTALQHRRMKPLFSTSLFGPAFSAWWYASTSLFTSLHFCTTACSVPL